MLKRTTYPMVTLECPDCGAQFERRSSRIGEGKCRSCSSNRKQKRVERTCRCCGKTFEVIASAAMRGEGKYCSRECWRQAPPKWRKQDRPALMRKIRDREGLKNPNYRGGDSAKAVQRRVSLEIKGESRCRNCGSEEWVHLHHVIPRSMFRAGRYEILNCIPLCASCHRGWHFRDITIHRDIFTDKEWAYLSSVQLLGQNTEAWLDERYPQDYGVLAT